MAATFDLSSEFASIVDKLQKSPEDPTLKQALLKRIPEMKALAKVNALALYRLAQIYPQNSAQYQLMMNKSADMGCTNALLALCELSLKSNTHADLKKAAGYMDRIAVSNDSYIIKHSRSLLETHPQLEAEMKTSSKVNLRSQSNRFFSSVADKKEDENAAPQLGVNSI